MDDWTAAGGPLQPTLSDGLRATRARVLAGAFIHSIAAKAYGCSRITVTGTGGTHAIAERHGRDDRVHVFDANNGHSVVRDRTLIAAFLDRHWPDSGHAKGFLESTAAIVGIRPPIS